MGRRRTTVGTAISRVVPDDQMPDSVKTGVTKALFKNGEITDYVLEELVNSIGVRAERMYSYGRDHYTHGLPSGQFTVAAENIDTVVADVLFTIENQAVQIDYLRYGAPNNLHIGWMRLIELHGYNPATNQLGLLTTATGTPVYLEDMIVVVPSAELPTIEPTSIEQWGIAARAGFTPERQAGTFETRAMVLPTAVQGDPLAATEYLRVEYVWQSSGGLLRDSFTIPVTGFDDQASYFQVRYQVGGVAKYWSYRDGAGTYPTLDAIYDQASTPNGSFFPFAYFRHNSVSEISDTTTQAYKTSKRLVKYLGMDYDLLAEAIDSNPGIADVQQAVLMLAVPANTTNDLERRYLWDFFNSLWLASSPEHRHRTEQEAALYAQNLDQKGLRTPGIVIQDTRFKMQLDNDGIYKRRKAGVIGPVGAHTSSVSTQTLSYTIMVQYEAGPEPMTETYDVTSHYYRRQISAGYYDEIQVVSMRTVFHINGDYAVVGDGEENILIIPLDRAITEDYSIPDREILYARSLHFVFNSLVITKVKWYQTGLFQLIMIVVAIVITYYTADTTAIAAALAAGAYGTAAIIIITVIVEQLVIAALFKLFVKAVGFEAAFVVAIVAAVLGFTSSIKAGSVAGAPFASELLMISSGLTHGIGAQLQDNIQDLINQSTEFQALAAEQTKTLETAKDLLDPRSILSPFVIFGEKPDDFYNRTVHSGNIGVVSIGAITSFVDRALTLPKLDESLGSA